MDNKFGDNFKMFSDAVILNSSFDDNATVGQDSFIRDSNIGRNCLIERRNVIDASIIGDYSYTGYNTVIKHSVIGRFTSVSWNVSIGGADHDYKHITNHPFPILKRFGICSENEPYESFSCPLNIGNDVWIGSNACILRGIKICNGAVIGAGSIVTHDVGDYEIWAGVPAKRIGMRFSEKIIKKLSDLAWWDMPIDFIKENIDFFKKDISEDDIDKLLSIKENMGAFNS